MFSGLWKPAALYLFESAAELLSTMGTISNIVSGISFTLASTINKEVNAEYYSGGFVNVTTDATVGIATQGSYNQWTNSSFAPFSDSISGVASFNLQDFISTESLYFVSSFTLGGGVLLKAAGDTLKHWVKDQNKASRDIIEKKASLREYSFVVLASAIKSIATSTSTSGVFAILYYAKVFKSLDPDFHYPPSESSPPNAPTHPFPLQWDKFKLMFNGSWVFVNDPPYHALNPRVDGALNLTSTLNLNLGYGVRVFTKNLAQVEPLLLARTMGLTFFPLAAYLENKIDETVSDRIRKSNSLLALSEEDDPETPLISNAPSAASSAGSLNL